MDYLFIYKNYPRIRLLVYGMGSVQRSLTHSYIKNVIKNSIKIKNEKHCNTSFERKKNSVSTFKNIKYSRFIHTNISKTSENKKHISIRRNSYIHFCINKLSAQSGCLDSCIRRRTYKAAISLGKLLRRVIAQDLRMGEP